MRSPVVLRVWDGKLAIDRRVFHLVDLLDEKVEA
jgi:hypothetical protein